MKSKDIVPYVDVAKIRIGNQIMESSDIEGGEITTISGTIQIKGLILDASDPELLKVLRKEIRLESEEGRNAVFKDIRGRVISWANILQQMAGQEMIDENLARRVWGTRDTIQTSLMYTNEASRYLDTFTDLDKDGKPFYSEQNMQTMSAASRYLAAYLSKVDVSKIDEVRLEILRNLKTDPNKALCISDGRVFSIPKPDPKQLIYSVDGKDASEDVVAKGKEVLDKWSKGTEMITLSDIYILRAYLGYFEDFAEGQKQDMVDLRTIIERGQDVDKLVRTKQIANEYFVGKCNNNEFAYNAWVTSGGNIQALREIASGFDAEKRRGVYQEVHADLETALQIAEQRMDMNLQNTDPIYKNIPPTIAAKIVTRVSDRLKKLITKSIAS